MGYIRFWGIICLLLTSCQSRRIARNLPDDLVPKENSKNLVKTEKNGLHVVEVERKIINPDHLRIYRANIATIKLGSEQVGRLQFFTDQEADYVRWQACPKFGDSDCRQGRSFLSEVFWGVLEAGPYTVVVRACVKPDRTANGKEGCGPLYEIGWSQPPTSDQKKEELLNELYQNESELKLLGEELYQIFSEFLNDMKLCQETALEHNKTIDFKNERQTIEEMISVQLQNLVNLGPDFVSYTMQGISSAEADDELAAILEATDDPIYSTQDIGPGYVPGGYSLQGNSNSQNLISVMNKEVINFQDYSSFISDLPIEKVLQASCSINQGFQLTENPALPPSRVWDGLKDWQKGISAASAILSSGLLAKEVANDFASYRFVSALLNIKRDNYPCYAFNKAVESIAPIKSRIRQLKDTIRALQKTINSWENEQAKDF